MKVITLSLALWLTAWPVLAADRPPLDASAAAEWAALLTDREAWYQSRQDLKQAGVSALPVLLVLAEHEDGKVRCAATDLLSDLGPDAVPAMQILFRRLRDENQNTRRYAATALGNIGAAATPAVPLLLELLEDEQEYTRTTAARALWKIEPAGPAALVALLRAGNPASIAALAAGKERSADVLIPLLADESARSMAEEALIQVGFRVVPQLRATGHDAVADRVLAEGLERYLTDRHDEFILVADKPPAADPKSLVLTWESGSGHGHTLNLGHLRWGEEGLSVTRLRYECPRGTQPRDAPIVVQTARFAPALGDALCRALLQALSLRLERKPVEPPEPGAPIGGSSSGWSSSGDFHARLKAVAAGQVLFDKAYSGYPGSSGIAQYFDLRVISGLLFEAIRGITWTERAVTEADLATLTARTGQLEDEARWVRERLLLMIRAIGDERFLPVLEEMIRSEIGRVARAHLYAIDAYARISGVDLRPEPFGEMDVPGVRERYLEYFDRK